MKFLVMGLFTCLASVLFFSVSSESASQSDVAVKAALQKQAEIARQKQAELQLKKRAELTKQRQAELAKQKQAELKLQKQAELAKQKQAELKRLKQAELRKQKQAKLKKKQASDSLQKQFFYIESRISILNNEAKAKDDQERRKRQQLRRNRSKLGDDYVDGKISRTTWRRKLEDLKKEEERLEVYWKRDTAKMKTQFENLLARKVSLGRAAAKLGLYLD